MSWRGDKGGGEGVRGVSRGTSNNCVGDQNSKLSSEKD